MTRSRARTLTLAVVAALPGACGDTSLNVLDPAPDASVHDVPDASLHDAVSDHATGRDVPQGDASCEGSTCAPNDAECSSAVPCRGLDARTDGGLDGDLGCDDAHPCSPGCCVDGVCQQMNCPAGSSCVGGAECCTGTCIRNVCQPSSMGGACCQSSDCESANCATMGAMPMAGKCAPPACSMMGNKCQPASFCDNPGECCSNICTGSVCQPLTLLSAMGGLCCSDADCESANCTSGKCGAAIGAAPAPGVHVP